MQTPHIVDPSKSQNLFPFIRTKTNINATAEKSLTKPKIPVRNSEDETDLKPADIKITGASVEGGYVSLLDQSLRFSENTIKKKRTGLILSVSEKGRGNELERKEEEVK
jgi:hypothetical protein